ncbi:hypothetical protein [Chitinophaga silvisoli]|uniref:RHS repeat protein n=1 Tax=Chitinophaga silvisoli TaxID=2291814 RepID=A0A3E1NS41_9BACT|nr:hypothetical protein [Chitinophaga silvisoli]RFM30730.1 hypothetical protein DXN04_32850 [Chitinophaga silvisoli]
MKRYILIMIYSCLILAGPSLYGQSSCTCECLKPLFDYLIASNRLQTKETDHIILASLLTDARRAGYDVSYSRCAILYKNINKYFYATSTATSGTTYSARIGDCEVNINATSSVTFSNLISNACTGTGETVTYHLSGSSTNIATLSIGNCYTCTTAASALCYSAVTDTSVNAYTYGLAGNWRPSKSYVYYGNRAETNTTTEVVLRTGGTISAFAPFWKVVNKKLTAQQDTTRWVWNSQTTLYNKKGLELETRDPLNRYTAGLYGYQDAMIIAATQNARYREATYEGFEDYYYGVPACDEGCSIGRNLDFSGYKSYITTEAPHTGKYSIRIPKDSTVGISASIVQADSTSLGLTFNTGTNLCTSTNVLKSIKATQDALLPVFSPIAGKQIVVSCWVKEAKPCAGDTYVNNRLSIVVKRAGNSDTTYTPGPKGAIIEGWQRYEQVVSLPAGSTSLSIYLKSLNSTIVYLDDLRIHPYNANMKSFAYDPGNLRLMAELDENNYATFFEYDDDGTLIRQKKETERGIKTISESRNALLKE